MKLIYMTSKFSSGTDFWVPKIGFRESCLMNNKEKVFMPLIFLASGTQLYLKCFHSSMQLNSGFIFTSMVNKLWHEVESKLKE